MTVHLTALAQLLFLLTVANGAPVIAKRLLGTTFARPLDGGRVLADGQPLFGRSKTIRGLVTAVIAAAMAGPIIGVGWTTGAIVGVGAMLGDLLSSFIKRRTGLPPSSMAPGIDQVPEALAPLLMVASRLELGAADIVLGVAAFWIGEVVLSRILFALKIRDRPY